MSFEQALADHTAALNRHSEALDAFVKASGKSGDATSEKPTRTRRTKAEIEADEKAAAEKKAASSEKEPARERTRDAEDPQIYDIVKKFLDYGDEDNRDDEDERDRRAGFVKKMLRFFEVERARDIPEKNIGKVRRWIKLSADGEKVDFEVD